MKLILGLLTSIFVAAALVAQPAPRAKSGSGKAAPAKGAKAEEPAPKIEGMEIPRPGGGFLGVQILNGAFKLNFYDAEKKPAPPDVARAVMRWDAKYKVGQERIVLNPGETNALSNPRTIRPPYIVKLFIVLLKDAAAESAEAPGGRKLRRGFSAVTAFCFANAR